MDEMDIEEKTIDDAIEKACEIFQVPREKLNIEILAEGAAGFLGLGSKKARIRASLLNIDLALEPSLAGGEAPRRTQASQEVNRRENRGPVRVAPETPAKAAPIIPRERVSGTRPAETDRPPAAAPAPNDPSAEKAGRFLEELLKHMQVSATVTVRETLEAIVLDIGGESSGLLIGKRGQNLDAIQYIVNKAVHHSANGERMIVIDTESYRQRREESLIALAMRAAEKARKNQKPVTIGHMNAHDRRIIHLAIQGDATLTTKSRGEGEYRSILILPARRGASQTED